jgi:hypothetical protein
METGNPRESSCLVSKAESFRHLGMLHQKPSRYPSQTWQMCDAVTWTKQLSFD